MFHSHFYITVFLFSSKHHKIRWQSPVMCCYFMSCGCMLCLMRHVMSHIICWVMKYVMCCYGNMWCHVMCLYDLKCYGFVVLCYECYVSWQSCFVLWCDIGMLHYKMCCGLFCCVMSLCLCYGCVVCMCYFSFSLQIWYSWAAYKNRSTYMFSNNTYTLQNEFYCNELLYYSRCFHMLFTVSYNIVWWSVTWS